MTKDGVKQRPFLYIHQSNFHQSNIKMQTIFSSKHSKKYKKEESDINNETKLTNNVEDTEGPTVRDVQNMIENYNQQQVEHNDQTPPDQSDIKPRYSFNRVRSFKEMDISEKINYLKNFPTALPPVPCLFIKGDQMIRGIFIRSNEDAIEVKQFDETKIIINKNELKEIKMIGY